MDPSNDNSSADVEFKDFSDLLALKSREADGGKAVVELLITRRHLRSLEILHGGVVASVLDSAMGLAAGSLMPEHHYTVTAQLNVNFIRPCWEGETLIATGEIIHRGQRTAVGRGEIRTGENLLVASGSATFLYIPHSDENRKEIPRKVE